MVGDQNTHIEHLRIYKAIKIISEKHFTIRCRLADSVKLTEHIYWQREGLDISNLETVLPKCQFPFRKTPQMYTYSYTFPTVKLEIHKNPEESFCLLTLNTNNSCKDPRKKPLFQSFFTYSKASLTLFIP